MINNPIIKTSFLTLNVPKRQILEIVRVTGRLVAPTYPCVVHPCTAQVKDKFVWNEFEQPIAAYDEKRDVSH